MELDALDWASDFCYELMGRRIRIRVTSEKAAEGIQSLLRSFPRYAPADAVEDITFSLVMAAPINQAKLAHLRPLHNFYRDDVRVGRSTHDWFMFRLLEWQTNLFLGENVDEYLLLHAGALSRNGEGIILPAPSESGKTSLTMALTRRGFGYMSDEFGMVDVSGPQRMLHPFPKPFSIKDRSLFQDLAAQEHLWVGPEADALHEKDEEPVWYIHPDDARKGAVGSPVPLAYVLFPRYSSSAKPCLTPLASGDVVRHLIENSVNFQRVGRAGLSTIVDLVRGAQCYSLAINDLQQTADLVEDLISR
ncbi:MAG: hypothetical protein J4O08_02505 [Chloroflexi bacterium]|nr:hypothetical protein [Chloroflexota bacterium]MCI0791529.1 hypothetical protein [Chloroflexota bacterium]MCI0796953.1 hypothetical protein [Chloroflexota bacterium]MCI0822760.1 hypothetical protein [Chloroflexota bacterium]MCI0840590.1 hypothetical protein [Chloroflexota bacterium]